MNIKTETVKLTKKDLEQASAFVKKRCNIKQDVNLYKDRGSFKAADILVGALSELGVYRFLKKQGIKCSKPDFTIHNTRKKSFEADLTSGSRYLHIKGQSMRSSAKYGASWLFQRHDPLIKEPERFHYIVPTNVNLDDNTLHIFGFISFQQLHDWDCISECAVPSFRRTKVAIYLENLASLSTNARWGFIYRHGGGL